MKYPLIIWLLLLPLAVNGQGKCFIAFNKQGQEIEALCVGQEVTFQDCGNKVPDENEYYVFNYKSGSPIPADASNEQSHTYATPGRYRVLQIANYGNSTLTDTVSQVFEVKEAPAPAFEALSCANRAVSVTVTDTNYDSYTIDFGNGQRQQGVKANTSIKHRYASPGNYKVTVTGVYSSGNCSGVNTSDVTALPDVKQPFLRQLTVREQSASGAIELALAGLQPGYSYVVDQWQVESSNPNYISIDTIRSVSRAALTHTLQNLNTTAGTKYMVRPLDNCGSAFLNSNAVSSIALQAASANEQVTLAWESMPQTGRFEVYRNGVLLQTLNGSIKTYTDTDVACGQAFQYQVREVATDGSISISATQEVQVTSTATPAAPYLFASYNLNNQVVLHLELPQGEELQQASLERSVAGAAFQSLAQAQQVSYIDESVPAAATCYRATFTNACGNTSAISNVSCPVFLTANMQLGGATATLEWTNFEGFPGAAPQYTVELLDENGNMVSSYHATGNSYTDQSLSDVMPHLRYRIKATSASGTAVTYSNTVTLEQEVQFYIPSGFTPNGDGLNDSFVLKGRFYTGYVIRIYNNLGQVIYQATEADAPWDGTYKGRLLPAGAFAYEITAKTYRGTTVRRTGTVTLLL